jgi:hypothetical protein
VRVAPLVVDFAELLGDVTSILGEGIMIRGDADLARGEVSRMCAGSGGRGRLSGAGSGINGMLFFDERWQGSGLGTYLVAGSRGNSVSARSSDEAWIVISRECAVVLEVCRECSFAADEDVDTLDPSVSDSDELSSTSSSGIDSGFILGDSLVTAGLKVQGIDSFIRSSSFGTDACVLQSSSFFTTQGFCIHRIFEKYALQAWTLDSG